MAARSRRVGPVPPAQGTMNRLCKGRGTSPDSDGAGSRLSDTYWNLPWWLALLRRRMARCQIAAASLSSKSYMHHVTIRLHTCLA